MAQPRWLSPWRDDPRALVRYHVINRVVDRRMVFGPTEREKFRALMRRHETFSGCRVLAYCILSNHFHLLLEVPPPPAEGLSDADFFKRLRALYPEARVEGVRRELEDHRRRGNPRAAQELIESYTYRMHDLSEFMKGLTQRFSVWFNRTRERTGHLWEERFKSLIVEGGTASRAVAAYIDLNPVRAGMAADPADYRWSSYGEAVAAGFSAKRAREGLVRALHGHSDRSVTDADWDGAARPTTRGAKRDGAARGASEPRDTAHSTGHRKPRTVAREYRRILLAGAEEVVITDGPDKGTVLRKGLSRAEVRREIEALDELGDRDLAIGRVAGHRVRYFIDGTALGGRAFVDGIFIGCRARFGPKRRSGARKPRGGLAALRGEIWSLRDLQVDCE